jgi:uncharacterized protein
VKEGVIPHVPMTMAAVSSESGIRDDGWAELVNDEEHGGCLIPMMMLRGPGDAPEPISPEKREDVIAHMAAGLLGAY